MIWANALRAIFRPSKKNSRHEAAEKALLEQWVQSLPEPTRHEMSSLYKEMEERQTLEAKIYKAIDSLEALIQHNLSDISTWSENEFELNLTYADDRVQFSDYLTRLRAEIRQNTVNKIANKPTQTSN